MISDRLEYMYLRFLWFLVRRRAVALPTGRCRRLETGRCPQARHDVGFDGAERQHTV